MEDLKTKMEEIKKDRASEKRKRILSRVITVGVVGIVIFGIIALLGFLWPIIKFILVIFGIAILLSFLGF